MTEHFATVFPEKIACVFLRLFELYRQFTSFDFLPFVSTIVEYLRTPTTTSLRLKTKTRLTRVRNCCCVFYASFSSASYLNKNTIPTTRTTTTTTTHTEASFTSIPIARRGILNNTLCIGRQQFKRKKRTYIAITTNTECHLVAKSDNNRSIFGA